MGKRGFKTGKQLPSSYDMGNPYVNLCLAVLSRAKADYDNFIFRKNEMWHNFQKTELYKRGRNVDPIEVAVWVSDFIGG